MEIVSSSLLTYIYHIQIRGAKALLMSQSRKLWMEQQVEGGECEKVLSAMLFNST